MENWKEKAINLHLKKCGNCGHYVTFIQTTLNENERTKQCPDCKATQTFEIAKAIFKNGKRLEPDGTYHTVGLVKVKGGFQILPIKEPNIQSQLF